MVISELLEQQAIDAAISGDWKTAIKINKEILAEEKDDLGAHMRLGFAFFQSNKLRLAKHEFKYVLKLQPKNNIAEEHLEKIDILNSKKKKRHENNSQYDPDLFIERKLEVRTEHDEFIGNLPDDISKRLCYFINEHSQYTTHIKEINLTAVVIFIREVSKGKKVRQYPSFPSNPHVMLSDIQHLDQSDGGSDDDEVDEDVESEIGLNDDAWEEYEQEKDLSSIVQIEDEEEE